MSHFSPRFLRSAEVAVELIRRPQVRPLSVNRRSVRCGGVAEANPQGFRILYHLAGFACIARRVPEHRAAIYRNKLSDAGGPRRRYSTSLSNAAQTLTHLAVLVSTRPPKAEKGGALAMFAGALQG